MYVRYFMDIRCICFTSLFISSGGILRCFKACIDCLCMTPLTPTVMIMQGVPCYAEIHMLCM